MTNCCPTKANRNLPPPPKSLAQSPRVRLLKTIKQRHDFLIALSVGHFICADLVKEIRCHLHQPIRIDRHDVPRVLFRRHDEFVVQYPLGLFLKQAARGVNVHRIPVDNSFVSFLGILFAGVAKESRGDRQFDLHPLFAARADLHAVAIAYAQQLLPDVLSLLD